MKVAIIGAGPAGLFLAEKLARRGDKVSVFDPRAPWEKPCGGGITPKTFRDFPELPGLTGEWHRVKQIKIILSTGDTVSLDATLPFLTISRKILGEAMLKRAREAGAEFFEEKVDDIIREKDSSRIITGKREAGCDFLVGADGATGIMRRKLAGRFDKKDICLAFVSLIPSGYDLPVFIRFYSDMTGYAWIFPRKSQASIGIAAKGARPSGKEMKERLKELAEDEFKKAGLAVPDPMSIKPAILPSISMETLENNRVSGPGWALIGDASGIVDPITGEGIYYALKTADILFQSLVKDQGESYPERLREFAATSLHRSPLWCETFYRGSSQRIWGWLLKGSPLTQKIIGELIQGEQDYPTLKRRLIRAFPVAAAQSLLSILKT